MTDSDVARRHHSFSDCERHDRRRALRVLALSPVIMIAPFLTDRRDACGLILGQAVNQRFKFGLLSDRPCFIHGVKTGFAS